MAKTNKKTAARSSSRAHSAQPLVDSLRAYCAAEGIGPHDPITLDTITHAVLFGNGQPPKAKKTGAPASDE